MMIGRNAGARQRYCTWKLEYRTVSIFSLEGAINGGNILLINRGVAL